MAITRILITAATESEFSLLDTGAFKGRLEVQKLVSGVGSVSTVYSLMNYIRLKGSPDYLINIGIAGSFNPTYTIGDAVVVQSDCFADLGIEDRTEFVSVWESGLVSPSEFPYENGYINADMDLLEKLGDGIAKVRGVTVNTATGSMETIDRLIAKYNPDIETMETAAALYVGRMENIPVAALRTVSNMVEPRNTDAWDTIKAISALQPALEHIIDKIHAS